MLSFYDGSIYDHNKKVAIKLSERTLYMGYLPKPNTEDCFNLWIMQSQECTIYINDIAYNVKKGDVLVFATDDPCRIDYINRTSTFTVLQINCANFLNIVPKSILFDEIAFLNHSAPSFNSHIPRGEPPASHIVNCLESAKKAFVKKELGYEFFVTNQIITLLLTIARVTNYCSLPGKISSQKRSAKPDIAFKKAIEYIDSHLSEELTLEKISEIAGLTPNYFSNIFSKQTGSRLWDYVSEKRILLATKLLAENPNDSIIAIALKCGYNNCPNFNRAFKKYTGQTPKKYKTSVLGRNH